MASTGAYEVAIMNNPALQPLKAGTERCGQGRQADSSRLVLSPRLRRLAVRVLPHQQYLAQYMEVAAQNGQLNIAAESSFTAITTTCQSVAGLQGVDGRLDSRMPLPCLTELNRGLRFLLLGLDGPRHRHARMGHDLGQLPLVFRRMEAAVKRSSADASAQTLLQNPRLFDNHVVIVGITRQQVGVGDEPGAVLVDQNLAPELHGFCGFAPLVQLGVRFEDAEQFLRIGDVLALKQAAAGRATDMASSLQKHLQLRVQGQDLTAGFFLVSQVFSQFVRTFEDGLGQAEEFSVPPLDPLLVTGSLAGGDAVDLSRQALDLPVQVLVLTPAAVADYRGDGRAYLKHFPQAVADQAALGGVVDVGLRNEGVRPHRLGCFRYQLVPLGDDCVVHAFEGFGPEERDVVADRPPVERGLLVPVADAHHLAQGAVLLSEVLKSVVVEVAAQAHGCQHEDRPVVHPSPPAFAIGVAIDVPSHRPENLLSQLGLSIDVLEGRENRNDLVTAAEVQRQIGDRVAVQPLLAIEGCSHGPCSSKIVACLLETPRLLRIKRETRSHLRGAFFTKSPGKTAPNQLWDGH